MQFFLNAGRITAVSLETAGSLANGPSWMKANMLPLLSIMTLWYQHVLLDKYQHVLLDKYQHALLDKYQHDATE